ncbi:hypothetical protein BJF83_17465 [Nocardiopsis sp. CNR-923]|nr:hypothetical protein BJF83_17465 [Nocardiopsis sp. CNR-923]
MGRARQHRPGRGGLRRCLRTLAQAAHSDALPAEDLVEPGDEVPTIAELHGWVERLDRDLSDTTKAVTQRLAAIEERLSPADTKATPASTPAWYQDKDGDIWGQHPDGRFAMVRSRDGRPAPYFKPRTLDALDDRYGPLTRVDDAAPAGGAE